MMTCNKTVDNPFAAPVMTQFTNIDMGHSTSMYLQPADKGS